MDRHIENLERHKNDLRRDSVYGKYAFVTYEDLDILNQMKLLKSDFSDLEDSSSSQEDMNDVEG